MNKFLCLFFMLIFTFKVQGQTLPNFMKDLGIRISMIKSTTNPSLKMIFAGNYIYRTDTNLNTISSSRFQTPNSTGSWSAYAENGNVSAAILDYAYVTPWESIIGNIICLVDRTSGDTIKTIQQNGFRSYYLDFHKDTLILFNKSLYNDTTFYIKKISTTGQVYSNSIVSYKASSYGKFKIFCIGSSIFLYSINQINNTSIEVNFKRLDLSGNLIQSKAFNISFPVNNSSIDITSTIANNNTHIIQIRSNDNSVYNPYAYCIFASDTLGNKLWESSIIGKYSSRSNVIISKISDTTFMVYGCRPKDSVWSYFMHKFNFLNGVVTDSVVGKLVHKSKELTSYCFIPLLITKSNGFNLLISYRNSLEKYSQYPISLVTNFDFDNELLESRRFTIKLNGYWLDQIINAKLDDQNLITFIGDHRPSNVSNYSSYLATYDFNADYEYTYYTVGTNQSPVHNSIIVYPNPTKNKLFIESSTSYHLYSIYNSIGQKVQASKLIGDEINISELVNGVYVLCLDSEFQHVQVKFIKE